MLARVKTTLKSKKRISVSLSVLAFLVSIGTVAGLIKLGASAIDAEAQADDTEEVAEATDGELTIELGDEPVFKWVESTVTVTEDMPAGYTLKAYSENSTLSAEGTDKTIDIVTIPEDEYENAGSLTAALTDNTWGLAVEQPESEEQEIYFSLPETAEEAVTIATVEDMEAEGSDTVTVYYGVYVTPDMPYGTYTGATVNYEVEPHYITNLSFNGNGSDGGVDMEGITLKAGDTIALPQNTYTKEGYSFTGWNTVATPTTEDPGVSYADEAEFTASLTESEDITLYAQWEEDILYMQNVSSWGSTLAEGDTVEAVDNRDGKTYYVSRLADGNIWMTQNLDLDLSTSTELTPANTNISSAWTPANSTIAFTGTTVEGWQNNNNVPYSADPGDIYYYSSGTTNNDDQYTSLADCQAAHPDCSMHNHAGNYYNWSAAVANNNTEGITEQYTNVDTDICPAGWRLPKNRNAEGWTAGNEQDAMISSYDDIVGEIQTGGGGAYAYRNYLEGGFNAIRTAPLWLARSGFVDYGSLNSTGYSGNYWSSTVNSSGRAYYLSFDSGGVYPANGSSRVSGYSVRCVAQ